MFLVFKTDTMKWYQFNSRGVWRQYGNLSLPVLANFDYDQADMPTKQSKANNYGHELYK